jgi:ATP-dependent DNA helicase RecG
MTGSELREIIRRGEDSKTQLKRQFNSIDALAAEIAAMLNSDGGQIIVGFRTLFQN